MRHILDTDNRGHVLIFDSPTDMYETAKKVNTEKPRSGWHYRSPGESSAARSYPGRQRPMSWDAVLKHLRTPWQEVLTLVDEAVEKVNASHDMPQPKSRKRKGRWNEDQGEIDVDRVLTGEAEVYRDYRREAVLGSMNVTLASHFGNTQEDDWTIGREGIWYRTLAAVAVSDILENLGYNVEIIAWNRCVGLYRQTPYDTGVVICRIKEAGESLEKSTMCDMLSHWWFTSVGFPARCCNPVATASSGMGSTIRPNRDAKTIQEAGLGGFWEHLEVQQNSQIIPVPFVANNLDAVVECVKEILNNVIEQTEKI